MVLVVIRRPLTVGTEMHARPIRVRFVFYNAAERTVFLRTLRFLPVCILSQISMPFVVK
jgi:hypothetical protein